MQAHVFTMNIELKVRHSEDKHFALIYCIGLYASYGAHSEEASHNAQPPTREHQSFSCFCTECSLEASNSTIFHPPRAFIGTSSYRRARRMGVGYDSRQYSPPLTLSSLFLLFYPFSQRCIASPFVQGHLSHQSLCFVVLTSHPAFIFRLIY